MAPPVELGRGGGADSLPEPRLLRLRDRRHRPLPRAEPLPDLPDLGQSDRWPIRSPPRAAWSSPPGSPATATTSRWTSTTSTNSAGSRLQAREPERPDASRPEHGGDVGGAGGRQRVLRLRQPDPGRALSPRRWSRPGERELHHAHRGLAALLQPHDGTSPWRCAGSTTGATACPPSENSQDGFGILRPPLFLGYETFIRGYAYESFSGNECAARGPAAGRTPARPSTDSSATRLAVANLEARIPLIGVEQYGIINFPFLPTELVLFADGGHGLGQGAPGRSDFEWKAAPRRTGFPWSRPASPPGSTSWAS